METTTTPTIEIMNRSIAEFDGWQLVTVGYDTDPETETEWQRAHHAWMDSVRLYQIGEYWVKMSEDKFRPFNELRFHSDWNDLMPVVEKISKMALLNVDNTPCTDYIDTCYPITFNMPTEDGRVMFRFKGFGLHEAEKLIDAVHAAVYEVARHENSQPPK